MYHLTLLTLNLHARDECFTVFYNNYKILFSFCIPFLQNFTKAGEQEAARCDTKAKLMERGCEEEDIISPKNKQTVVKEVPLSGSFNQQEPIQLSPQTIELKLRPGEFDFQA